MLVDETPSDIYTENLQKLQDHIWQLCLKVTKLNGILATEHLKRVAREIELPEIYRDNIDNMSIVALQDEIAKILIKRNFSLDELVVLFCKTPSNDDEFDDIINSGKHDADYVELKRILRYFKKH